MKKQKKFIFDWNKGNITKNLKHGVSVEEQEEVFYDVKSKRIDDHKHSIVERRFFMLGETKKRRKIIVAFTVRDGKIRPISARQMNRKEVSIYEETVKFA